MLAALPALEDLGSAPPLSLVALRQHLGDSRASELVEAVLLADDLLQRDAFIAGEDQSVAPSVLSDEQVRGKEPLVHLQNDDVFFSGVTTGAVTQKESNRFPLQPMMSSS